MTKKRCVLITGSSRGLGAALALVFSEHGFDIILHGRNSAALKKVCKKIQKISKCRIVKGDLLRKKTLDEIEKRMRAYDIDVLINNAAIPCPNLALNEFREEDIYKIIDLNLSSVMALTKRAYSYFLTKKNGTIININSLSGREAQEKRSVYCASKWGLRGFSESLRKEAEKNNIKVMGIFPGRIRTKPGDTFGMQPKEVAEKIFKAYEDKRLCDLVIDNRPKKRQGA